MAGNPPVTRDVEAREVGVAARVVGQAVEAALELDLGKPVGVPGVAQRGEREVVARDDAKHARTRAFPRRRQCDGEGVPAPVEPPLRLAIVVEERSVPARQGARPRPRDSSSSGARSTRSASSNSPQAER